MANGCFLFVSYNFSSKQNVEYFILKTDLETTVTLSSCEIMASARFFRTLNMQKVQTTIQSPSKKPQYKQGSVLCLVFTIISWAMELYVVNMLLWFCSSGPWLLCCFRWVLAFLLITFSLPFTTSVVTLFPELRFWPSSWPPFLHPLRPAFMCILWNINVFLGLPAFLVPGFFVGYRGIFLWEQKRLCLRVHHCPVYLR